MESPFARDPDPRQLEAAIRKSAVLARVQAAAMGQSVFVVGGTVRDLLIGLPATDLDLVIEGPVDRLARTLDPDGTVHDRFETAEIALGGHAIDLARARTESYPRPGALPEVSPATLQEDLSRRDFSINAMAVAIDEPDRLIDPHAGLSDLERGVLRPLREGSFTEDPTRVIRAARYAVRFGLDLEPGAAAELRGIDLGTPSTERLMSELRRLDSGERGAAELAALAEWGVVRGATDQAMIEGPEVLRLLADSPWRGFMDPAEFARRWLLGQVEGDASMLTGFEGPPSVAVRVVAGEPPDSVLLARVRGAEWLDRWLTEWRGAEPAITGEDLVEGGVSEGPAVGAGLQAALAARLDDGVTDFDAQLAIAMAVASEAEGADPTE